MTVLPGGAAVAATPSDVLRLIDAASNHQDDASTEVDKQEMLAFLTQENAYEVLSEYIVSPAKVNPDAIDPGENNGGCDSNDAKGENGGRESPETIRRHIRIKRSFRCMTILANDTNRAAEIQRQGGDLNNLPAHINLVLNPTRAGLLAKKLFVAYRDAPAGRRHRADDGVEAPGGELARRNQPCRPTDALGGDGGAHIPHVNRLLTALLDAYPNAVISAASAGGRGAMANTLGPMLALLSGRRGDDREGEHRERDDGVDDGLRSAARRREEEEDRFVGSSTLAVFARVVVAGCTGRNIAGGNLSAAQQQAAATRRGATAVSKGHRRKFVHSLVEFELFAKLAEFVTAPGADVDSVAVSSGELACDSLLGIVESISFPPTLPPGMQQQQLNGANTDGENESVGEEFLLQTLSDKILVESLCRCAGDTNDALSTSASKTLLGIFELCTGQSKKKDAPPVEDATEGGDEEAKAAKTVKALGDALVTEDNKLRKSGTTTKIHANLVSKIEMLVEGLNLYPSECSEGPTDGSEDGAETTAVRHPGRYVIERPFTLRRLQLITLLADVLSFEETVSASASFSNRYEAAVAAMDALMKLPLPPSVEKAKGEKGDAPNSAAAGHNLPAGAENGAGRPRVPLNPWPALCELLFEYPENNMYQVQFFRLLQFACLTNHEATLKLLVQKCKFVSRAIKACGGGGIPNGTPPPSHRGVILRCLNVLRLQCQRLPPSSFLRHYLDSHDGWKNFHETLIRVTTEQQTPGGGIAVPQNPGVVPSILDGNVVVSIDLGSAFAAELGFDPSVSKYVPPDPADLPPKSAGGAQGDASAGGAAGGGGGTKSKNKKKKKKKK